MLDFYIFEIKICLASYFWRYLICDTFFLIAGRAIAGSSVYVKPWLVVDLNASAGQHEMNGGNVPFIQPCLASSDVVAIIRSTSAVVPVGG